MSKDEGVVAAGNSRRVVAAVRLLVAAAIVVAVIVTALDVASRTRLNVFNLFGYFTIQSNLILGVTYVIVSVGLLRRRPITPASVLLRACATGYIIIVGIVYAVLLAPLGAAGGVPVPWANVLLHIIAPLYAVIDWLTVDDRRRLPASRLPVILIYPALWLVVILIRGATDGWFPYPFLDPAIGYGAMSVYIVGILVAMLAVGAIVFATSRLPDPVSVTTSG